MTLALLAMSRGAYGLTTFVVGLVLGIVLAFALLSIALGRRPFGGCSWAVLVVLSMSFASGCAHARAAAAPKAPEPPAAVDQVLRVIGRFGMAHACSVALSDGQHVVLTNAHVIDERPFDAAVDLYPVLWSDGQGNEGLAVPVVLKIATGKVTRWFALAAEAPRAGDRVSLLGYRFDSRDNALADRRVVTKVTRVVAGHVLYATEGPGSSGSCVLNARDEVIGINAWSIDVGQAHGDGAGLAVGLWGAWLPTGDALAGGPRE